MENPNLTLANNEDQDAWSTVTIGLITLGICALAPRVAYEVLYRCQVPEIQDAINDQATRAVLFLYITIGTVFTASFSSFMGSFPILVDRSKLNARRIIGTLQCIFSLLIIIFFFLLGPPHHSIDLTPFITKTKEFTYYMPNHYLSYVRGGLAVFGLISAIIEGKEKVKQSWRAFSKFFKKKSIDLR